MQLHDLSNILSEFQLYSILWQITPISSIFTRIHLIKQMKNSLLEQKRAAHFIKNRNEISTTIYPDIFLKKIYRKRVNFIISFLDLILIYTHFYVSWFILNSWKKFVSRRFSRFRETSSCKKSILISGSSRWICHSSTSGHECFNTSPPRLSLING